MESKLVKQGKIYCVSVFSAPELVTCNTFEGSVFTLVDATEPGQYYFCAPTWKINFNHPGTIIVDVEDECVI